MEFVKKDFYRSFFAGGAIAILSVPILKNLKLLDWLSRYGILSQILLTIFWALFWATAISVTVYVVYKITVSKWPVIFEISKYGTIGLLNTFLSAAIFNFLMIITDIGSGIILDVFIAVSFAITTTHSFFWNRIWTFNAKGSGNHKKEYFMFFAVTGFVSFINVILMHFLINTIGSPEFLDEKVWINLSFVILVPVSFLGNFFGYKFFVFKNNEYAAKTAALETI